MKRKLSKTEIIELMGKDWVCRHSIGIRGKSWWTVAHPTEGWTSIHKSTAKFLRDSKKIVPKQGQNVWSRETIYVLPD